MRIVSQDGARDIPYQLTTLQITTDCCIQAYLSGQSWFLLGKYNTVDDCKCILKVIRSYFANNYASYQMPTIEELERIKKENAKG